MIFINVNSVKLLINVNICNIVRVKRFIRRNEGLTWNLGDSSRGRARGRGRRRDLISP